MKAIESVLLDIDGTIIDSNEQHAVAWQAYLARKGRWLPLYRVSRMIGMGGDKILRELYGDAIDAKTMKKWSKERDELFLETHWKKVKPFPGAAEFLGAMHRLQLRVAVATSASQILLAEVRKMVPELERFTVGFTTADEAERSKPSPDIFVAGVRKFMFDPARTVVIGDTPYDIEAADGVPCRAIAVRTGGFPVTALAKAVEIWRGVQELGNQIDRSILSR